MDKIKMRTKRRNQATIQEQFKSIQSEFGFRSRTTFDLEIASSN